MIIPMTTIIIIIVIIPRIYSLPCNTPIRDKLQKWSGTSSKKEEPTSTALMHIFCVVKQSGIQWNAFGMVCIILLRISCVQKWSGTNNIMHSLLSTASLHISCVLRWSGTYANEIGSKCTASLHISYVLRCPGIVTIQLVMFIYALCVRWGLNFMVKIFLYLVIRQKILYLCPQFFCFLFFIFCYAPIPPPWWMPSNGH